MHERPTRQVSRWRTPTTYLVRRNRPVAIVQNDGGGVSVVIGGETLRLNAQETRDVTLALLEHAESNGR